MKQLFINPLKSALALSMVLLTMFMTSCSDTEEPGLSTDNEIVYESIKLQTLSPEGTPLFTPHRDIAGMYVMAVDDSQKAYKFVESLMMTPWNGKLSTVNLGEYGYVRLAPGTDEGVFASLSFALKDCPTYTLQLGTEEYCNSVNTESVWNEKLQLWECPKCSYTTRFQYPYCPNCEYQKYREWFLVELDRSEWYKYIKDFADATLNHQHKP